MKAVIYNGPYDVKVKDVPDAKIVRPTDVLVRITTTNICGSDLHMYEGRTSFEQGRILVTKTWVKWSKLAQALNVLRWATMFVCRLTWDVVFAKTVKKV